MRLTTKNTSMQNKDAVLKLKHISMSQLKPTAKSNFVDLDEKKEQDLFQDRAKNSRKE